MTFQEQMYIEQVLNSPYECDNPLDYDFNVDSAIDEYIDSLMRESRASL